MSEAAAGASAVPGLPPLLDMVHALDRRLQRFEVTLCGLALGLMIALAFLQVVLRQLQGQVFQPVGWFDNVARHLVIWVGMLGASVATAEGRHISIEALPKLLGPTGRRRLALLVNLAAAGVTGLLLAVSLVYLFRAQIPDEHHLFIIKALGNYKVYRWPFLVVVPWGLLTITLRFLLRAVEALVLDDATFAALAPDEAEEVAHFEEQQQRQGVSLLLDLARQSAVEGGATPGMDPERARDELRDALRSDRWRQDEAVRHGEPPRLVGRTTEELPIYQDLSDEGDLVEPEVRQGGVVPTALTESGDILSPDAGEDALDDDELGEADTRRATAAAEDAVERVADTQRLSDAELPAEDEDQEPA